MAKKDFNAIKVEGGMEINAVNIDGKAAETFVKKISRFFCGRF